MKALLRHIPRPLRRFAKTRVCPPLFRTLRRLSNAEPAANVAEVYSVRGKESFVGYYDVAPTSPDGGAILAHVTEVARRALAAGDEAAVGYFDRETCSFSRVAKTTLWCWQLGARLRWWPGEQRALAFNAFFEGQPAFCLATSSGRLERLSDRPLFDVSADGTIGLALNFGRLANARPGYGYPALEDPFADEGLPHQDGVTIVEIASGRARLIASLSVIAGLSGGRPGSGFHYLNAASLSPSGTYFSVLHKRLAQPKRSDIWDAQAVVGKTDGTDLQVVPLPGAASHYWWLDDTQIAYTSNPRGATLHSGYFLYDTRDRNLTALHTAAPNVDGHPSLNSASGRWITDRYPDLCGEQTLYTLEPDGSRKQVARLRADPAYSDEWKCDLHPRWRPDSQAVIVDSTHDGYRAIYEIPVPPVA